MNIETATLAGGCFWCTEAIFKRLKGVISVMSGYSGGKTNNPSYEDVSSGQTGHAEAIQVTFDPNVITYNNLLDVFWHLHDPTTLNRQGNDVGTQYKSVIFYHNEKQKKIAEQSKKDLEQSGKFDNQIVTQILPYDDFFKAESNHQNFYDNNRDYAYCRVIIDPKIRKLMSDYKDLVASES